MANRLRYTTTVTIQVCSRTWGSHLVEVHVTNGRVSVVPPAVMPMNMDDGRARDLARVILAASARGRAVHRRLFGRNP
jgi:hypothetical protein